MLTSFMATLPNLHRYLESIGLKTKWVLLWNNRLDSRVKKIIGENGIDIILSTL